MLVVFGLLSSSVESRDILKIQCCLINKRRKKIPFQSIDEWYDVRVASLPVETETIRKIINVYLSSR